MNTISAAIAATGLALALAGCTGEAPPSGDAAADAVETPAGDSMSDAYEDKSDAIPDDADAAANAGDMPSDVPLEPNARPPGPKADADY